MTGNQMIAAIQAAVAANGGNDVALMHQVSSAHAQGDKMSSVSSIIYVGPTIQVSPGQETVQVAAVLNILLP